LAVAVGVIPAAVVGLAPLRRRRTLVIVVGLLAGLSFLPSPSTQYRFLQDVSVKSALDVQTVLGRRLVALAQVTPGPPVTIDGELIASDNKTWLKLKGKSYEVMPGAFEEAEQEYFRAVKLDCSAPLSERFAANRLFDRRGTERRAVALEHIRRPALRPSQLIADTIEKRLTKVGLKRAVVAWLE
jgi:hypothetical protein